MYKTIAALAVALTATTASAEINYDYENSAHTADMICIAAYGVGRDLTHGVDNNTYSALTDLQNSLILKYAYSKQLNKHVETRKMLLEMRGIDALSATIAECAAAQ